MPKSAIIFGSSAIACPFVFNTMMGKLEEVNHFNNLNYSVIVSIFTESTSDYKDLAVGDFWDLKFEKKLWKEDGLLEEAY